MRLINAVTLKLESFFGKPVPQYAILSHTWGDDKDEVSFIDIQRGGIKQGKKGYFKIKESCKQSLKDGLGYIWIDTCCINKDSDREVSEAINSMFQWYQNASVCYTYLSDVLSGDYIEHPNSKFCLSRWFNRGWTLQELLAPSRLYFYDEAWTCLGTKTKLSSLIQRITGIPRPFLQGFAKVRDASVAQRMFWAARRNTKRDEDLAYSLLGIFDIAMPMIYGEGGDKAFRRLQQGIMEQTRDHSILAWQLTQDEDEARPKPPNTAISGGVLARAPSDFANCAHIVPRNGGNGAVQIYGGYLRAHIPVYKSAKGYIYGLLDCGPEKDTGQVVGIPLMLTMSGGQSNEYFRPRGHGSLLCSVTELDISLPAVCIKMERDSTVDRENWFSIEDFDQSILELVEVHPHSRWQEDRVTIATQNNSHMSSQLALARFRTNEDESADFVVVLENGQQLPPQYHIMVISKSTSLQTLSERLMYMRQSAFGLQSASNGQCNLSVTMTRESIAGKPMFVVRLFTTNDPPEVTFDATLELQQLDMKFDLVDVLLEQDNTRPLEERWDARLKEDTMKLESTKSRLEVVEESLKALGVEKLGLVTEMAAVSQRVHALVIGQNEIKRKKDKLSKKRSEILRKIDKALEPDSTGAWFETTMKRMLEFEHIHVDWNNLGSRVCRPKPSMFGLAGRNQSRHTPLTWAVVNQRLAIVEKLLGDGADIEAQDVDGITPLAHAASAGHEVVAKLLLDNGADKDAEDIDGNTPLARAAYFGREAAMELLLKHGADKESQSKYRRTPLAHAASAGHEITVKLLLDNGANKEAEDIDGYTPLILAVASRYRSVVKLLLDNGANIEHKDNNGSTALALAVENCFGTVTKLLLENGANVQSERQSSNIKWSLAFEPQLNKKLFYKH